MLKNGLDEQYIDLLKDILENGVEKDTRNGKTLSVFGRSIRYKFKDGKFPLLTTKKMAFKTMTTELLWFLRGDTSIEYLVDNGCHIWDGDAYKNWCKQFEVDPNDFNGEEVAKGHNDQCWGYPILDHVNPTSKEYKRGQINAYLEDKADKPFFYLTQEEFINKIKTDDEFATKWGSLGKIYGYQWRNWNDTIDQISELIKQLKETPDSRRLIVTAWNPSDLPHQVLPPCHYGFQVYTRELSLRERKNYTIDVLKYESLLDYGYSRNEDDIMIGLMNEWNIPKRAISLMWNQRSVDTFLGLPFNIASYGLLLEIIAKEVNMVPDELIGNLGDTHLYLNHIEQAKEQIGRPLTDEERYHTWFNNNFETGMERFFDPENIPDYDDPYYTPTPTHTREPFELPTLYINDLRSDSNSIIRDITKWSPDDFKIQNYKSHPSIKAPLSN